MICAPAGGTGKVSERPNVPDSKSGGPATTGPVGSNPTLPALRAHGETGKHSRFGAGALDGVLGVRIPLRAVVTLSVDKVASNWISSSRTDWLPVSQPLPIGPPNSCLNPFSILHASGIVLERALRNVAV